MTNRPTYEEKFSHRYKTCLWTKGRCAYCDAEMQCLDHVPAISQAKFCSEKQQHQLVPACKSCNAKLSNNDLPTIKSRTQFLKHHTNKRPFIMKVPSGWKAPYAWRFGVYGTKKRGASRDFCNAIKKINAIQSQTHPTNLQIVKMPDSTQLKEKAKL